MLQTKMANGRQLNARLQTKMKEGVLSISANSACNLSVSDDTAEVEGKM